MTAAPWAEYAARDFEVVHPPTWRELARPEQLPPAGGWLTWLFLAGRGAGKTRSAAEWTHEQAGEYPGCRIALVGRTPADVRDVMIEGESGILAVAHDNVPVYQPTKRRLSWPNGSAAYTYSAEVPSQLRGPQHHFAWCDEPASWTDARKGDVLDTAWNNLMLGLRLGRSPRCVATTTPKPLALVRTLLGRESTVVTKGSTYDNLDNLAPSFRDEVLAAYEGTRIGRQELLGELLEDVEGALWSLVLLDENRVAEAPDMRRIVVAVDPSGGSGPDNDEQGIIVAGLGVDGELYVLADRSCRLSPNGWASRAVGALHEFAGDRIVAERNYGGEMVLSTIRQVSSTVAVKVITASRGKVQRAEPVAAAYEQHRVHHVGAFAQLEDQLTTWTPQDGTSPDRLDACLAGGTQVLTARGEVPIEHVIPGEPVWTRQGWKAVLASRCTRRNAKVLTAELSSGRTLTATPDHRVWVQGKGWTRMDALVWADRLSACQSLPSWSSTGASGTSAIPTPGSGPTGSTTSQPRASSATIAAASTATSGATTTPARTSPRAGTSTTTTTTRSTTTPATSSSARQPSMARSTRTSSPSSAGRTSTRSVPWLPSGIAPRKAGRGTASTGSGPGKAASARSPRPALSAAMSSSASGMSEGSTAPGAASIVLASASTWKPSPARSAGPASSGTVTTRTASEPAPVSVVGLSAGSEPRDVYDLTVADAHEFVAAGVIVHNCVWALTELTGNFGGDAWIAWARKKAEAAADGAPAPEPAAEPDPEPAPQDARSPLQRARNAAYAASQGR